jgi:hypothetical protein
MSVNDSYAKLNRAAKDLAVNWQQTLSCWQDENARQFEKKYIMLLQKEMRKAGQAMETMDMLLSRIQRECK